MMSRFFERREEEEIEKTFFQRLQIGELQPIGDWLMMKVSDTEIDFESTEDENAKGKAWVSGRGNVIFSMPGSEGIEIPQYVKSACRAVFGK
jgi:hypothetical protein